MLLMKHLNPKFQINRHIPVQHAYQRKKKFPGMNSVLKKTICLKKNFLENMRK